MHAISAPGATDGGRAGPPAGNCRSHPRRVQDVLACSYPYTADQRSGGNRSGPAAAVCRGRGTSAEPRPTWLAGGTVTSHYPVSDETMVAECFEMDRLRWVICDLTQY